jgi:hypothetical protein
MVEQIKDAGPSLGNIGGNHSADVNWAALTRAVTYQVCSQSIGWVNIPRTVYAQCANPATRRILLRDEQRIINSTLLAT